MSLLNPKNLEERIVRLLGRGGLKNTELLAKLGESGGKKPTKQGFYVALRKLKAEDAVVVYKGAAALNITWLKQMAELFDRSIEAYGGENTDILSLADKESVSYHFGTLRQLDNFWGHMQDIVVRATPASEPVYTYDPHYWFYPARQEVESAHIAIANSLGKQFLMTVGGTTPLDKALLPDFNNEMRQYHMEKLFDKETYYLVIVGDYVFETHFDEATTQRIESIYARHATLTEEAKRELKEIPALKVRTRLRITRSRTRARKLKTKLGKNFLVRKQ